MDQACPDENVGFNTKGLNMNNMLVFGYVMVPVLQIQERILNVVMVIPSKQEQVIVQPIPDVLAARSGYNNNLVVVW